MMYASVFLLLIIKHCICDYGIQGRFDPKAKKDTWLSPRLWLHGFDHAVGTAMVFAVFCVWLSFAIPNSNALMYLSIVIFAFSDLVIHSMIDCVKNKVIHGNGYNSSQRIFWWINMFDQIAHHVTYFIFLWCFDKYFF